MLYLCCVKLESGVDGRPFDLDAGPGLREEALLWVGGVLVSPALVSVRAGS